MKTARAAVQNLIRKKLAWGIVVMIITQILGSLPALDCLPANVLKYVSFALGCLMATAKGAEMYFDQSAQLESQEVDEPAPAPAATPDKQ